MTYLIFQSREVANLVTFDIAATPDIDGGIGSCWVWFHPDVPKDNAVTYAEAPDGRVAMAHPWSEPDTSWLSIYCADFIASGQMQVLSELPADWYPPVQPEPPSEAVSGTITFKYVLE